VALTHFTIGRCSGQSWGQDRKMQRDLPKVWTARI